MMKKKLLIVAFLVGGAFLTNGLMAQTNIPMQIIDPSGSSNGNTKVPARPWYVTQDGYTLTLPALADDYIFELLDDNGEVVYTTFLPARTTTVVLPSTLSGEFELRLVADTFYYKGYIVL